LLRKTFLATLSGIILILAFPTYDYGLLAFFALVPLFVAIDGEEPVRSSYLGLLTGLVFYLGSIPWIVKTMTTYGGLPLSLGSLVFLVLALYLALYYGAFCYLLAKANLTSGLPQVLFAPILWVALEYLRTYLLTGFPWNLLGYSQYKNLPLLQLASLTGVYGISFLLVLVNVTAAHAIIHFQRWRHILGPTLVAVIGFSLALAYSWKSPPPGRELTVSVLQGNIEQGLKWSPALQKRTLEIYRDLTLKAALRGPTLIVWPETAAPFFLRTDGFNRRLVSQTAREAGTYLLVGSPDRTSGSPERYFNSAFFVSPGGEILGKYDKIHLVPFGEYVPLKKVLFFVKKMAEGIGDFSPGRDYTIFPLPWGKFGVTICFEVIFPDQVRRYVNSGAEFLVNITNDAWFGRSAAPYQHLSMAVLRAVENGVYMVRAANTGVSAIIAPNGRILKASGIFVEAELTERIRLQGGGTFYTRYGDVFAWAASVITILVLSVSWLEGAVFVGKGFRV